MYGFTTPPTTAEEARAHFAELCGLGLELDLTRGKPCSNQLELSSELLALPGRDDHLDQDGQDVRNYGNLVGISDLRDTWADVLGVQPDQLLAADSSSLNIMFDLLTNAFMWGTPDSERPWKDEPTIKWICPVPGYDFHFNMTQKFGCEMLTVPMTNSGPDIDAVLQLVQDPTVKGMWLVPIFSNPTGTTTSREVAEELARMETAAPDFRIVWDNAYAVHTLTDSFPEIIDVVALGSRYGHPNRFWHLSSTSKITFAGAGVSFLDASKANLDWYLSMASVRGIGPNKVNQLAHARFFTSAEGVRAHMLKHADIIRPKFHEVLKVLNHHLSGYSEVSWTDPSGGYFIAIKVPKGSATRVITLAAEAGISLTEAGCAFPLHHDPDDAYIRLAPTSPSMEDLLLATHGLCTCIHLVLSEDS